MDMFLSGISDIYVKFSFRNGQPKKIPIY